MASLDMQPRSVQREEAEAEEAHVLAAIRLHEWVQANLQRLKDAVVPVPGREEKRDRQLIEAYLACYEHGVD